MDNPQEKAADKTALKILLIEDSDTDAFVIQNILHRYMKHVKCTRAATFESGEGVLQSGGTDLVLLDLGLPDTADPADTYARIKKWADKLPIVVMTNIKDHDLARVMVQEGAADFMNKDIIAKNPRHVQDAIDFSVERHALTRKLASDKEDAIQESKQKDTIINCFMGGYSGSEK